MRSFFAFLFLLVASPVLAQAIAVQDTPEIAPNAFLGDIWEIVQPIVTLLVSTVGPVLVAWIGARIIALLKITDENKKLELEQKLRDALHESAMNALLYATARFKPGTLSSAAPEVIGAAVEYIRNKNPETVEKLGVDDKALRDIVMSKVGKLVRS